MRDNSKSNLSNGGFSNMISRQNTRSNISSMHQTNNAGTHLVTVTGNNSEFELIKEEKDMLNRKLDDFTKILGEFQRNQ